MRTNIKATILGLVLGCAALMGGNEAKSDATASPGGTEAVYGHIPRDQVEFLTPGDRIKSVASSGAPMAIWEALEHGERVECLECIPAVSPLLYDANARTREIAAWWLRRRIIGVRIRHRCISAAQRNEQRIGRKRDLRPRFARRCDEARRRDGQCDPVHG